MPTKTWKTHERKIAKMLDAQRNGNRGTNTADVETEHLAIEVKHTSAPPKKMLDALSQAKRNAPEGKTPVVILHAARSSNYIAVLDLADLLSLLGIDKIAESV